MQRAPESGSHKRARRIVPRAPRRTEPRVIHRAGTSAEVANHAVLLGTREGSGASRLGRASGAAGEGGLWHRGRRAGGRRTSAAGGLQDWGFHAVPWISPTALASRPLVFRHANPSFTQLRSHRGTCSGDHWPRHLPAGSFGRGEPQYHCLSPAAEEAVACSTICEHHLVIRSAQERSPSPKPLLLLPSASQLQEEPKSCTRLVPGGSSPRLMPWPPQCPAIPQFPCPPAAAGTAPGTQPAGGGSSAHVGTQAHPVGISVVHCYIP